MGVDIYYYLCKLIHCEYIPNTNKPNRQTSRACSNKFK